MAEYQSGGISFGGLGSGTDFSKIITQMKKVEKIQMDRLIKWRDDWKKRVEGFDEINAEIQKMKTAAQEISTPSKFVSKTASSSEDTVATATTTADVTEGLYKIEVAQIARNAVANFNQHFDKDEVINSSGASQQFTYTYKGTTRTITVPNGTKMENFINMINGDPQNPGVKAALVKDGDKYLMQLRGLDLGAKNTLTIDSSTVSNLGPGNAFIQPAQDAAYKINGYPPNVPNPTPTDPDHIDYIYYFSETNTLKESIDGMTVTLKDVGSTQISVNADTSKTKEKIQEFVDAVNAVRTKIKELTKVDADAKAKDPGKMDSQFDAEIGSKLTGNYGVQLVSSRLKDLISRTAKGFIPFDKAAGTGDIYNSLPQVGILTVADEGDKDNGLLKIDEEKLDKALQDNPEAVIALFSADFNGHSDNANFSFHSAIKPLASGYITHPGEHSVSYTVKADGTIDENTATINGKKAKVSGSMISGMEDPSKGLAVQVDNMTPGTYSGNVYLQQGKAGEVAAELSEMLSEETGTLNIIKRNYQEIMKGAEEKIIKEQERLVRWERTMRLKFARLDETLTKYNGKMSQLQSQLGGLNK